MQKKLRLDEFCLHLWIYIFSTLTTVSFQHIDLEIGSPTFGIILFTWAPLFFHHLFSMSDSGWWTKDSLLNKEKPWNPTLVV